MAIPKLFQIDWAHLFVPTVALGEIILRGSLVYLLIFALMRVILKREAGSIALPDLSDDSHQNSPSVLLRR